MDSFDKGGFFMQKSRRRVNTHWLVFTAVLTAVSAVCNVLTIQIIPNVFTLTFTTIPCFIAGVFVSPLSGFIVGMMGDLIGQFIHPLGAYLLPLGISCGLIGLIPGLLFKYAKIKQKHWLILLCFIITTLVCSIGINTTTLWYIHAKGKKTFIVYLLTRGSASCGVMATNYVICFAIYPYLIKLFKGRNFSYVKKTEKIQISDIEQTEENFSKTGTNDKEIGEISL